MKNNQSWIDQRFPLSKVWNEHLAEYYTPRNFNFWYFFGGLAVLMLGMQLITGIFLTMYYKPDAATDLGASIIVKGLRSAGDFDIEMQMAQTNKSVSGIETIFIPSEPAYSHISSRFIREISTMGGDISALVPNSVANLLLRRSDNE